MFPPSNYVPEPPPEPVDDGIPDIEVALIERDGRLFIHSWDVVPQLRRLNADDLIRIGGQVYEVLGYISSERLYWIAPVSNEDVARLSGG